MGQKLNKMHIICQKNINQVSLMQGGTMYKNLRKKILLTTIIASSSLFANYYSQKENTTKIDKQQVNTNLYMQNKSSNSLIGIAQVTTNGSKLNVRENANLNSPIVSKVNNKDYLEIYSETTNWYYVKYSKNKTGYISKNYSILASKSIKKVNANSLNIRKGPSTNYAKIGTLTKNTEIGVLLLTNSWAKIVYDGNKIGYVSNNYLSDNYSQKYSKFSINTKDYKQFDSRWANKKLGNSSKTFKSSGCAVTALSIMESYRTKKDITPYDYSKTLKFTSSGALYWPTTTYNVSSSISNPLTTIYNTLKKGQPIMVGLKDKSGNQHYVVVYGFTGGNTLSSNSFLIRDPGSSSRTKLNELLAIKPIYYKIITIK